MGVRACAGEAKKPPTAIAAASKDTLADNIIAELLKSITRTTSGVLTFGTGHLFHLRAIGRVG
jgi:hypothetical protein